MTNNVFTFSSKYLIVANTVPVIRQFFHFAKYSIDLLVSVEIYPIHTDTSHFINQQFVKHWVINWWFMSFIFLFLLSSSCDCWRVLLLFSHIWFYSLDSCNCCLVCKIGNAKQYKEISSFLEIYINWKEIRNGKMFE